MPVRIDQTDIEQLRPAALLAALAFARHEPLRVAGGSNS